MDFIEELRQLSSRLQNLLPQIKTEEATKHSLILPFIQLLGYSIFDPSEVVPEYTADVGTKKGEKVDYAIMINGSPAILIEAKPVDDDLTQHDSQLFRYFSVTDATFAILTNGVVYKFYSDLQVPNRMDNEPFLTFSMLDLKEPLVAEIKKFRKATFNAEDLLSAAANLKYTTKIRDLLDRQLREPTDEFLRLWLREVYDGKITQNVLDQFRPIVKRAFSHHINELITDRLKSAMKTVGSESKQEPEKPVTTPSDAETPEPSQDNRIETTVEELEAFFIVKSILRQAVDPNRITHKDTASYFGVLIDDNTRKWVCRFFLSGTQKSVVLRGDTFKDRKLIDSIDDIYNLEPQLVQIALELSGPAVGEIAGTRE